MSMTESAERAERRARQRELADRLKASGALDGIFEQIDAGQVPKVERTRSTIADLIGQYRELRATERPMLDT